MEVVPKRGRIVVVNFEMFGTAAPPEMVGDRRLCLVVQNEKLVRGRLVTIVPLSSTAPENPGKQHHRMSHLSFQDLPVKWDRDLERWAKCDYIATVSLDRCVDPYEKPAYGPRKYRRVQAAKVDTDAVDKCIAWSLGLSNYEL